MPVARKQHTMARELFWRRGQHKISAQESEGHIDLPAINPGETLMRLNYQIMFWMSPAFFDLGSLEQLRDRIMWGIYVWPQQGPFPAPFPPTTSAFPTVDQGWYHLETDTWDINYVAPGGIPYGWTNTRHHLEFDLGGRRVGGPVGQYIQLTYQAAPDWNPLAPMEFWTTISYRALFLSAETEPVP